MGRFDPTGPVDVPGLVHSVADLSWGVLRGADGPSDGSAGAASNVPSALGVLRHAEVYAAIPSEIEDAFAVLEHHVMRDGVLYPVALAVVPILMHTVRSGSPVSGRIARLVARYAAAQTTLEGPLRMRLQQILSDHAGEIIRWRGRYELALATLVVHVPGLRGVFIAAVEGAERVSPEALLALVELGEAPGESIELAWEMLESGETALEPRMAAAAFLAKLAPVRPDLASRLEACLPPRTQATLHNFVERLWTPTIARPVVAPTMYEAEVMFAGKKLVIVRAGSRSVTLPWRGAVVEKGDRLQVGLTSHGEPKIAVVTDWNGNVRIVDFDAPLVA